MTMAWPDLSGMPPELGLAGWRNLQPEVEVPGRGRRYRDPVRWWQYAVWVIVVAYMLGVMVSSIPNSPGGLQTVLYLVFYLAAAAGCYVAYRHQPYANWLLPAASVVGLGLHELIMFSGTSLLFLAVWMAPFRMRLWAALTFIIATTGGYVSLTMFMPVESGAVYGLALGLGWAGFLALLLNQLRVSRAKTVEVARAEASAAVLNERQRLARDIHDILAHSLSAQVMYLEGARLLIEQGADQALILDRVTRAGDLARAGLDETKRAVEALRGDQTPLADQLEKLAAQFRSATGRPCALTVADEHQLAPEAWLAVVRTAQEALTNVRKHAPDAEVMMVFRSHGGWYELDVRDNGGPSNGEPGNGYGLVGMRERAELIGGTLEAGPAGDGFRVRLRVPA
jgi:signal transduction histidine kinase